MLNIFMRLLCQFFIFSIYLLTACSGGGSNGSPSPSPTPSPSPSPAPAAIEHLGGGDATVMVVTADAFSEHSDNLTEPSKIINFNIGNDFFENPWIAGSASTSSRDGLGGLFNNNACQDCHVRDGRGHAPNVSSSEDGTDFSSTLLKAVKTNITDEQRFFMANSQLASVPDSSVGPQLQHDAIIGVTKEVNLRVSYEPEIVTFDDGFEVELRKPIWHLESNYADQGFDFNGDTIFSARVAPQMIGLGLLALISEEDIISREDSNDADGDGISGVANYVWSVERNDVALGRFGWRAGQPSLIEQAAGAFVNDMGLTSRLQLEENCMPHQEDCLNAENGNGDSVADYGYEVPDRVLDAVAFYSAHLAVPVRRNAYSETVQAGKQIFNDIGCVSCHVAEYTTENSAEFPELSEQRIFPYTDLLLHDMGEALADFNIDNNAASADHKVEFLANAREWRTPPLWGIGLAKTVDPEATFLHDGRARNLLEAVLWHGGEAESSKQAVLELSAQERESLIAFLNDL